MKRQKTTPLGQQIIGELRQLVDAMQRDEPLEQKFNRRTVKLRVQLGSGTAKSVVETRKLLGASQTVFAQFLGVSPQTVRSWEQNINKPSHLARRFLDEIRHDPAYWRTRLAEVARQPAG